MNPTPERAKAASFWLYGNGVNLHFTVEHPGESHDGLLPKSISPENSSFIKIRFRKMDWIEFLWSFRFNAPCRRETRESSFRRQALGDIGRDHQSGEFEEWWKSNDFHYGFALEKSR